MQLHRRLDRAVRRQRGQRLLQQRRTCRPPRPARRSSSLAMMAGVVILLKFAKIRESVSVVASAKERNRTADAIGKWLLAGALVLLGLYTLYASWRTLLELALGIVVIGAVLAGLYVILGRKLQRALGVFFGASWCSCTARRSCMTLLSFQDSRGADVVPGLGHLLDATGTTSSSTTRRRSAARLDRRLAQAQRARVRDHGGALAHRSAWPSASASGARRRSSTSCCCR